MEMSQSYGHFLYRPQLGGAHPSFWGCAPPFVHNDEFSSTLMEQRTLDAIGVLIISTTAGGGVLG